MYFASNYYYYYITRVNVYFHIWKCSAHWYSEFFVGICDWIWCRFGKIDRGRKTNTFTNWLTSWPENTIESKTSVDAPSSLLRLSKGVSATMAFLIKLYAYKVNLDIAIPSWWYIDGVIYCNLSDTVARPWRVRWVYRIRSTVAVEKSSSKNVVFVFSRSKYRENIFTLADLVLRKERTLFCIVDSTVLDCSDAR